MAVGSMRSAVLIFPQGMHGRPSEERGDPAAVRFKTGVAYVAEALDAPVVPFGLAGTEQAMPPFLDDFSGIKIAGVPVALKRWKAAGLDVAIYSSGSVAAQKMLFGTTADGDLTPLLAAFFDTAVGPKIATDSYCRISSVLGCETSRILFVSDASSELDAARAAGCQTLLAVRPGNLQQTGGSPEGAIHSFDEIQL